MKRLWMLLAFVVACGSMQAADSPTGVSVREIGSRRELFVDDYLIERMQGVELVMQLPTAHDVALVCNEPWEGNTSAYYTLFADGDRFRMYYRGAHFDVNAKTATHPEFTCYAESRDGLMWTKPKLGLFEFGGSKDNNIVWSGEDTHNFTPFKDANPACADDARYKALGGSSVRWGGKGLRAYKSPDGIRWALMQADGVLTTGDFDSQNLAFWHPEQKRYVAFFRKGRDGVRDILTATSLDFIDWSEPVFLNYGEAPSEHLYTNAIGLYPRAPHLLLGFPTRFQPAHQQVEPTLMTSRDGLHFRRWPKPLIPITAPQDRDGNRSNYMTSGLLQLPGDDRTLSVYATEAYYAGPGSRVRRFTFRTDGFVSAHAGPANGELLTPPLRVVGKDLEINFRASATGHLRVELQDVAGNPIPGFAEADCPPITGDAIAHFVRWRSDADLGKITSQPIRLKFLLTDADLFAVKFNP